MSWLAELMKQSGVDTQEELAAKLQLAGFIYSRSAISSWVTGNRRPPLDDPQFRRALARILRITPRELLRLAGYEVERTEHSHAGERAANIVDQLPGEKQDLAIRLLEQLLTE